FSAYPKYENRPVSQGGYEIAIYPPVTNQVVVGYTVTNSYSVKVRDLDKVSDIAKVLTDTSVSSLYGPNFSIDDSKSVEQRARAQAIADAKSQAHVLARQLGVRLGKIVDFQEGGAGGYSPSFVSARAA